MTTNIPLISVLIPVYNRISLVSEAIDSVLTQDYANFEVVVSDNCSTDGTWELLNATYGSHPKIQLVRTNENLGPVPNWINCLNHARGEFIKFVFSDDWILPGCLTIMSHHLISSHAGVVISSVIESSGREQSVACDLSKIDPRYYYAGATIITKLLVDFTIPVSPGAALYRRNALKITMDYGDAKLNALAKRGIGPDLVMLLHASFSDYILIPDILAVFRRHGGSISEQHSDELHSAYRKFLLREGRLTALTRLSIWTKLLKYKIRVVIRRLGVY